MHFHHENISALSSLVDSRRIVLTHARRSQQLILFSFLFANKFKISPRRDSNSRTNTSSIRGLPLVHGGDRLCTHKIPISYVHLLIRTMYIYSSTSPVQVQSSLRVPRGLAGLGPFGPPGTLGTGGTQVLFGPPGTLGTGRTQSFRPLGTLWTGGTPYFLCPRYPGTGGTQSFQPPGTLWTVGLSHFSPPGTLRTDSSKLTRIGESLT